MEILTSSRMRWKNRRSSSRSGSSYSRILIYISSSISSGSSGGVVGRRGGAPGAGAGWLTSGPPWASLGPLGPGDGCPHRVPAGGAWGVSGEPGGDSPGQTSALGGSIYCSAAVLNEGQKSTRSGRSRTAYSGAKCEP